MSFNQLAVTIGILVSYLVGYGFAASGAWRWMLGLGAVPGVILAIGMLLLPETPRWLAGHGHADRARAALRFLRGATPISKPKSGSCGPTSRARCKPCPRAGSVMRRRGCR